MDRVFAEGYLNKLQPFGSRSRHRWFELTSKHFAYYDIEAGECMGRCTLDNIERVAVDGDQRFTVRAREPFTKTGAASVRLEAASEQALDRWITSFTLALGTSIVQVWGGGWGVLSLSPSPPPFSFSLPLTFFCSAIRSPRCPRESALQTTTLVRTCALCWGGLLRIHTHAALLSATPALTRGSPVCRLLFHCCGRNSPRLGGQQIHHKQRPLMAI